MAFPLRGVAASKPQPGESALVSPCPVLFLVERKLGLRGHDTASVCLASD